MKRSSGILLKSITIVFILLFSSNCTDESETINLEEDEQARETVFRQIIGNEALLNEFLNELNDNEEAMNLVMSHGKFLRQLYSEEFTKELVRENPDMREMMIQNMIAMMQQDTTTYNQVNEMMDEFHEAMGEMR